ncbi:MAG: ABC transporter permease [Anaerolineae bacterium]|nr:ABC transporter permease [Anaerolineae bacterium]
MNWRAVGAIIRKDIKVVLRSKAVLLPIILVPLFIQVILPAALGLGVNLIPQSSSEMEDLAQMMSAMPPGLQEQLGSLDEKQLFLTLMLVYVFAPFFLIVPLMVSSVIAADSFAGEKERKTLEALLHSAITNQELLAGKLLAAWLPAIAVSLASFLLYGVIANAVGWPILGQIFFPTTMWFVLVLWVAPAVSGLGLGVTVLISSRVKTFQEAYQLGGIIVVPIVALVIGQAAGVLYLSSGFTFALGLIAWLIDAALLWLGIRTFQRERLLAQL